MVVGDPLAEVLGAGERGLIEYRHLDAVKLAGHSCPTAAGAWPARAALAQWDFGETPRRDAWQGWGRSIVIDHADNSALIEMTA
jgi:hypothetical protein